MKIRNFVQIMIGISVCLCTVNLSAQIHVDSDKDVVVGTPAAGDPDAKVIVKTVDEATGLEVIHKENMGTLDKKGAVIGVNHTAGSSGTATGLENTVKNSGTGVSKGFVNSVNLGTGAKTGFLNNVVHPSGADISSITGYDNLVSNNSASFSTGFRNNVNALGNGGVEGFVNNVNQGTGAKTGFRNTVTQKGGTAATGFNNKLTGGTAAKTGFLNQVSGDGLLIGVKSNVTKVNNASGVMYSFWNEVKAGSGSSYGLFNRVDQGTGIKTGIYSRTTQSLNTNKQPCGIFNKLLNKGTGWGYGIMNIVDAESDPLINRNHGIENRMLLGSSNIAPGGEIVGIKSHIVPNDAGPSLNTLFGVLATVDTFGYYPRVGVQADVASPSHLTTSHDCTGFRSEARVHTGTSNAYGFHGTAMSNNSAPAYGIYTEVTGTNAPNSYAAFFKGNVVVDGTFTNMSDRRIKKEIEAVSEGLSIIDNLRPVSYYFDEKVLESASREKQYGFIAQEVQDVLPSIVKEVDSPGKKIRGNSSYEITDPDGKVEVVNVRTYEGEERPQKTLGMNYLAIIPILVKAVQEQQDQIKALETRIEELERR